MGALEIDREWRLGMKHDFVKVSGGAGAEQEVLWCTKCGLVVVEDVEGKDFFWIGMQGLDRKSNFAYGNKKEPECGGAGKRFTEYIQVKVEVDK